MKDRIYSYFQSKTKKLVLLIDPDKFQPDACQHLFADSDVAPDLLFVGGSLLSADHTSLVVAALKNITDTPVILFPGNSMQVVANADAILFLSLISGRNPDFLIGQHVQAAPIISQTNLEVIPTSYILVDGGSHTSVQYISQTLPVPHDKPDIAAATALAGKYLGHRLVYLEAGSGAKNPVSPDMVTQVCTVTDLPVIAGGGIRSAQNAITILKAGASAIVTGTLFEQDPDAYRKLSRQIKEL